MNNTRIKETVFLFVLAFGLYANTWSFDYALDDKIVIINNEFTQKGIAGITDLVTNDSMVGFFGKKKNLVAGGRYRPLALVTHAVEWEFFGRNPAISHFFNALIYALTAIILYKLLQQFFNAFKPQLLSIAFIATFIWVVHPLHTEVVANIKSRDELLSTLGALAAFYFFVKYYDLRHIKYLLFGVFFFLISLFSKESSAPFIAIIPLAIYFFRNHLYKKQLLFITASLAACIMLYLLIRFQVIGSPQTQIARELMNNPFIEATYLQQLATAFFTFLLYFKLLFFPHPLTHDYYPKQIPIVSFSEPLVLLSILVHIILIYFLIKGTKNKHPIAFGLWLYFLSFSLYANILFPIGTLMNERFLYIPSIGFAIIIAFLAYQKFNEKRTVLISLLVTIGFLFSFKTVTRNYAWQNDEVLALTDVKTSTQSAKVNMSAGLALIDKARESKNLDEKNMYLNNAIGYLNAALAIYPQYSQPVLLLGNAYTEAKNYDLAITYYETCLKRGVEVRFALQNLEHVGDVCNRDGLFIQAAKAYETLVVYDPTNTQVLAKVGEVYGKNLNNPLKALDFLQMAYNQDPKNTNILQKLGVVYAITGNPQKALQIFLEAAQVEPKNGRILLNIGLTYQNLGQHNLANQYIQQAFELEPNLKNTQ